MKLPTREMGEIQLLVTWEKDGKWEAEVEPLRGTRIGDQLSIISQAALDHALYGLSRPLVDALGIPPVGALRKLPVASRDCANVQKCPFYEPKNCHPTAKAMPWCFEPGGLSETAQFAAARLIAEWREGVYVVVVREDAGRH